jgi:hypothetical protein
MKKDQRSGRASRLAAVALVLGSLTAAAGTARADFQYNFTVSGTITSVNDLTTVSTTGQQIHLLPDVSVGQTFSAFGSLTADALGTITLYFINGGPPGFSGAGRPGVLGRIIDPNDLTKGFSLSGGGTSFHMAVPPTQSQFDVLDSFTVTPTSFSENLHHVSLQTFPNTMSVSGTVTSMVLVQVPEPSSVALLAVGLAAVGFVRARLLAAARGG